jgi:hypothetical protein
LFDMAPLLGTLQIHELQLREPRPLPKDLEQHVAHVANGGLFGTLS